MALSPEHDKCGGYLNRGESINWTRLDISSKRNYSNRTSVPVVALCRGFPWCLEYCCTSNGNWHLGESDVRALRWLLRQSVSDEYSRRYSTYLSRSKFSMLEARISQQIFIIIILFTIGSLDLLLIAQGLICFHFLRQPCYSVLFL